MGIFNRLKQVLRSNQNAGVKPSEKRNLFNIEIGDIVSVEDTDYEIEAIMKFNDHGWSWTEYKLKDGRKTYWLSVEQDDDVEVALYEEVPVTIYDQPKVLEYKETKYFMQEGSDAVVEAVEGKLNVVKGEQVDYYEYCDEDGENILAVEIWNGEIEMSIGRWVEEYHIEIYPHS